MEVLWQCGKYYKKGVDEFMYGREVPGVQYSDFIARMDLAYAAADVVVSRSGASSVSEICAARKGAEKNYRRMRTAVQNLCKLLLHCVPQDIQVLRPQVQVPCYPDDQGDFVTVHVSQPDSVSVFRLNAGPGVCPRSFQLV